MVVFCVGSERETTPKRVLPWSKIWEWRGIVSLLINCMSRKDDDEEGKVMRKRTA